MLLPKNRLGDMLNDVIKQHGVVSVGTLYRECVGREVFHHEQLNKSHQVRVICCDMNLNECYCTTLKVCVAGL